MTLLKNTFVAPRKLVPVIVTTVPTGPRAGEKPVMSGATRKSFVLMMVPPGVMTVIGPVRCIRRNYGRQEIGGADRENAGGRVEQDRAHRDKVRSGDDDAAADDAVGGREAGQTAAGRGRKPGPGVGAGPGRRSSP